MRGVLIGLLAFLLATPACALPNQLPVGGSGHPAAAGVAPSYTGPGDIQSFTAWYGLRAYNGAIVTAGTQALVNLRRSSDSHTCDVIVSASGGLGNTSGCSTGGDNGTAVATWCNATNCFAAKLYDQTNGNHCASASCDVVQATTADQPQLVFSCIGSLPCLQGTTNVQVLASANNFTPATGVDTMVGVANRASGTGGSAILQPNGGGSSQRMGAATGSANTWYLAASATITVSASDASFHAENGVINGASSVVNLDGTETTGTTTGTTTAGSVRLLSNGSSVTFDFLEAGFADNVAISGGTRTSLCQNEQAYYGAGNFGAAC